MEIIKKHAETVVVLAAIFSCFLWMNGKFNSLEKDFSKDLSSIRQEMSIMKSDISLMKAIMIMNGHYPKELAANNE